MKSQANQTMKSVNVAAAINTQTSVFQSKLPTPFSVNALRAIAAQPPVMSIGSIGNRHTHSLGGQEGSYL